MEDRVIIIGAGLSGLGAAKKLYENGLKNILIFEASNKCGGRIDTLQVENGVIELGAQWLHGTDNDLYKIAKQNNLILDEVSKERDGLYVRNDGYIYDNDLVAKANFLFGKAFSLCETFVDKQDYPKSMGDFFESELEKYVNELGVSNDLEEKIWELIDWNVRFELIDNCCSDFKSLSAKGWGQYEISGFEEQRHINLKGGYKALIDVLHSNLPEEIFKFNTKVTKISLENNVVIETSEGEVFKAKHVIITVSLGVLKNNLPMFNFNLPPKIYRAISSLGFGSLGKIFLLFRYKWWDSDGFQLIWKKDAPKNWLQYITGFDIVLNQPNMLLGWIADPGVKIMETLSNKDVGRECVGLLKQFLKRTIPYPIKVYKTNWLTNPLICGGYSNISTDCDKFETGASDLRQPLFVDGVPKLLFAGEGAHPSHFSTTHGAYESGQNQAAILSEYLKK